MVASAALLRVNIYAPDPARSTKKERNCPARTSRTPRPGHAASRSRPAYRQRAAGRGRRAPSATGPQDRRRGIGAGAASGAVGASRCRVTVDRGGLQGLTALFLWSDWLSCTRTCICTCSTSPGLALRGSKEQPHACSCKPVMQLFLERVFQEHVTRIREVGSSNPRVVAVQYAHP